MVSYNISRMRWFSAHHHDLLVLNNDTVHIRYLFINKLHRAKMYWNPNWKSPGFVPYGANLIHLGAKYESLSPCHCCIQSFSSIQQILWLLSMIERILCVQCGFNVRYFNMQLTNKQNDKTCVKSDKKKCCL